jgi:seryl-tRNA synthetase
MLDLNLVVEGRERILDMLAARGQTLDDLLSWPGLEGVDPWVLDGERRALIREVEELRHRQRKVGEEIARRGKAKEDASELKAEMKGVADRIKQGEARLDDVKQKIERFLLVVPNVPDPSVPVGKDAAANVEVRRVGEPPALDFAPRAHWDLGPDLGILDFERAAKISGARFAVYWDLGARLERALIQLMLDLHLSRGYREVIPPYLVTAETLTGTGQLPKFEGDLFKTSAGDRDLYLIPTAEVPLTCLHRDEILDGATLPRKYVAFTPCFRSEAGSYGKDVRGLIRQHQFHKVELVKLTTGESSMDELEGMVADAEEVLKRLGLPYRVVVLSTGDMGFAAAKTYDIEVWLPGQQAYREISSCSNCTDFQARRAGLRYRPEAGSRWGAP